MAQIVPNAQAFLAAVFQGFANLETMGQFNFKTQVTSVSDPATHQYQRRHEVAEPLGIPRVLCAEALQQDSSLCVGSPSSCVLCFLLWYRP